MILERLSLLGALAALVIGCGTTSGTGGGGEPQSADIRPFKGDDVASGKTVDLTAHLGKDVVLVSFWATWCEPCKVEMPFLQEFHDKHASKGLAIVSVAMDRPDTEAEVAPYVRKQGYTFPIVIDRDGSIAQSLNPTSAAPYALIIGRDGKVKKRISGFQPAEAKELEHELEALLAESAAP